MHFSNWSINQWSLTEETYQAWVMAGTAGRTCEVWTCFFPFFQRICRRLLAVYDLPSWGRCELALSLLLEHSAPYSLEDVVQAVRESHDREFIKRVLAKECPICLSVFPHSKVLTPRMFLRALQRWSTSRVISSLAVLSSPSDAVSDIVPVFGLLRLFPAALHHRCEGQTH